MLSQLIQAIERITPPKRIERLLEEKQLTELRRFSGSTLSLFLNQLGNRASHLLVVAPDVESATRMISDLQTLASQQGDSESEHLLYFPPTRRRPYDDQMVVDLSVMVQRSEVLETLKTLDRTIIVTSADALAEKLIPADDFSDKTVTVKTGDVTEPDKLREHLTDQGYRSVSFVDEPGEFAVRGGIFDVFPFSGEYPVRLEFFGDEVESIREFEPDSQRSIAFRDEARFVPNAMFNGQGEKHSLFDYLPEGLVQFHYQPDLIRSEIEKMFEQADKAFSEKKPEDQPEPGQLYLTPEQFDTHIGDGARFIAGSFLESAGEPDEVIELNSSPHPEFNGSFKLLREHITQVSDNGGSVLLLCNNQNQKERFEELLGEESDSFRYRIGVFTLHEGFLIHDEQLSVLTDHQIFNRYHRPSVSRKKRVKGGISFKELRDLNIGDYVVHVDYGIGKFAGFKKIEVRDTVQEAVVLRYQEDSTLYVNVASLHKLQKYSGKEGTAPRVTRLGSGEWARKKSKTRKKVKDIARDLIRLYAKRKTMEAHAFSPDGPWQTEMEARFEFEETPDQLSAIEVVKRDMESSNPMDRLVCGDVGFGKTEVAVRAAFKAVMDQKQVAVLVPTTILADQHYKTFSERMKDFPVRVEVLSRFRSTAEQKEVIRELKAGKVDILIGTHRIISKDVEFDDLGLLIIDEEQRFGVTVKEKLKKFRASLDVLTLTATPIPRTLQFSLMGARDLSIIHTPPPNRQPVYTEIHSFNPELIRDAIIQESSRGGQIFFIHNRVKNIEEFSEMIRQLVPEVRVRFAHGQMKPSALEKIIHDFYRHKFDLLVSTNIVENGIDISNANTILINNANHFGLSELHQLRGRVGRSNRKAFCYLLTPPVQTLTPEARKRLTALEEFSDLGSGFNIAMRDLDIRGAGDILGAEQSGFINELGFELYTRILNDAVRELKEDEFGGMFEAEPVPVTYPETQVEFDASAYLDSSYVMDSVERLNLYRKLSQSTSSEELDEWREELEDRFGPLPETAENLLIAAAIKLHASRSFFKKVTIRSGRMWLVCPDSDDEMGPDYFGKGLFQKQLNAIGHLSGDQYKVIQKDEKVRLVIHDIDGHEAARDYLAKLHAATQEELQEVTA